MNFVQCLFTLLQGIRCQNCLKKSKQSVVNNDDDQGEADAASGGDSSGRDNEKGWGLATGEDD